MSMITILMIHCMKYTRVSEFVDVRSHDSNIQERMLSLYYLLHAFDLDFVITYVRSTFVPLKENGVKGYHCRVRKKILVLPASILAITATVICERSYFT